LVARYDAQLVIEFPCDHLNLAGVVIEVPLFAGDFEMPGADEIALDIFFFHDALDGASMVASDAAYMRRVSSRPYIRDELVYAELQPVSTMPPLRELAPQPMVSDSSTTTFAPRLASASAAESPVNPAPMMATSALSADGSAGAAASDGGEPVVEFLRHGEKTNKQTLFKILDAIYSTAVS
jgi:hypothetical protein